MHSSHNITTKKIKGLPLLYCITALAIAATVTLSLFITTYTYTILKDQEKVAREQLFHTITDRIQKEINYKTTPVFTIAKSFATSSSNLELIATSPYFRKEFLYANTPTLLYYPTIFSINYSLKNGFYCYLVNLEHLRNMLVRGSIDKAIIEKLQQLNFPSRTKFLLVYNSPDNDGAYSAKNNIKIECYNTELDLLTLRDVPPFTTPDSSRWFKKTLETHASLTLTGPYIAPETNEQVITFSCPLDNNTGAYAITTHLNEFMHFVIGTIQSLGGSVYVLNDEQTEVLSAHPDPHHAEVLEHCEGQVILNHNTILHSQAEHDALVEKTGFSHSINHALNALLKHHVSAKNNKNNEEKQLITINGQSYNYEIKSIPFAHDFLNILILVNHEDINTTMRSHYINMIFFTIIVIAVMIPIVYFSTRKIGRSITTLSKEATRIAQKDFSPTLPVQSRVLEVKELASAMGLMKAQLKNYTEELQYIKGSLEEQVQEKTKDLQKALQDARNATEEKGMFLSAMSHELRTPMNAILGFTYIFDKSNLTKTQEEQLEKIRFSGESLLHIINDILDFSKLESKKIQMENIEFSLNELLKQTMDIMQSLAKNKGIDLILEKEENLPDALMGDPNRLRQIFINLIGNAIKFTDHGHVKLIVKKDLSAQSTQHTNTTEEKKNPQTSTTHQIALIFHVQDTGIGMTDVHMSRLFQVFSQADSSISRKYGGSGLGLTISKQLITLMGGDITVRSTINEGSTFSANVIFEVVDKEKKNETLNENNQMLYKENALALVVDDRQINLEVANALFRKYKVQTQNALSGKEAIELVKNNAYDIIFLDVQMPEMDGHSAARMIRNLKKENISCKTDVENIPIIAMTANAMPEDRKKSLEAGMDEHLAKPITPASLLAMIQDWLAVDKNGNRFYPKRESSE